eukprot:TRINITY_DN11808_c0_g1_i2.p1 TRINITY_DN11808_c0_g1~~TRINITY_DN11808_c0_g1_i2.p1  ORF type:complete len:201 (-),score=35.14 TRINITY_DN11808_c0_g1_i2:46-648(-)
MQGCWLGARQIRVNWANQKTLPKLPTIQPTVPTTRNTDLDYQTVLMQSSSLNTTVYIGGFSPETNENDLLRIFSDFGYIEEVKIQGDKGYGFVRFSTHESAAKAIVDCNGASVGGRVIKCSWGKERPLPQSQSTPHQLPFNPYAPIATPYPIPISGYPYSAVPYMPYNMNVMPFYNTPYPMPYGAPQPYPFAPPQQNIGF